jgi:hypothetical protein
MGRHSPGVSRCGIYIGLFGITEMNERIKKLIKQCTTYYNGGLGTEIEVFDKEKFAELIIKECAKIATYPQLGDEESYYGNEFAKAIKKHFGVEE